jgi:pimeloyl-ACP methyl ester carboxylesterase
MDGATNVRRIRSAGLSLAAVEHSAWAPGRQSVILVHGYPDQQDVWDAVIASLPHDELHIVTYDVRGAGSSDVPEQTRGYRTELLVEDLLAVVRATVPDDGPFHLVGHDWGSVQLWDVINAEQTDARLTGRVASFTSISGPSLDHVAGLTRRRGGRRADRLSQMAHSWYIYAFHVPLLPDLTWRCGHRQVARRLAKAEGLEPAPWGPELGRNAANGLGLYRANFLPRLRDPGVLRTDVPVQILHPTRDRFVTRAVLDGLDEECSDLVVVDIDAGHWVIRSHPGEVARLVKEHIDAHR